MKSGWSLKQKVTLHKITLTIWKEYFHSCMQIWKAKGQRSIFQKESFNLQLQIKGQNLNRYRNVMMLKKWCRSRNLKEIWNRKEWPESSVLLKANLRQGRVLCLELDRWEFSCVKPRLIRWGGSQFLHFSAPSSLTLFVDPICTNLPTHQPTNQPTHPSTHPSDPSTKRLWVGRKV